MSTEEIRTTSNEIFSSLGTGLKKIFQGDVQGGLDEASKSGDKFKEHFDTIFKEVGEFGKNYKIPEEFKEMFEMVNSVIKNIGGVTPEQSKETIDPKMISKHTNETIKVEDFTLETLPNDKIVMAGGTNLTNEVKVKSYPENTLSMADTAKMGEVKNTTVNETKNTNDINLNISLNGDTRFSKDEIMLMLNKTEVIQELNRQLKMATSNNGLT